MHDVVVVGVPLFAILAGILFSRNDVKELRNEIREVRAEVKDLRSEVLGHLVRIDAHLRQFYHLTGSIEARMDSLEKR